MPSSTPVYGIPYQANTDPPDGPNLGEDMALAIEAALVSIAASVTSLTAVVNGILSPTAVTVEAFSNVSAGTTSVAFVDLTTTVGQSFVAPANGKVVLAVYAEMANSGANYVLCAPEVKTGGTIGSGTAVLSASADYAARMTGTSTQKVGEEKLLTGLTPGALYNVRLMQAVSAGTGTYTRRRVLVKPTQ